MIKINFHGERIHTRSRVTVNMITKLKKYYEIYPTEYEEILTRMMMRMANNSSLKIK